MMHPVVNFIAFQAGWFSCVLGAAHGRPFFGVLATAAIVLLHLFFSGQPGKEARLILIAVMMGLALDSLLVSSGLLSYEAGLFVPALAPYWILAMWALFATTLNVSMRWMHGRPVLALALGAIGGPLSYLAGARLGAVEFAPGAWPIIALAVGWAIAMPVLVFLAKKFDGAGRDGGDEFVKSWAVG